MSTKMYRIVYRLNGVIDFIFCMGDDDGQALCEFRRRRPGARELRVHRTGVATERHNNVIVVDFKSRKKAS